MSDWLVQAGSEWLRVARFGLIDTRAIRSPLRAEAGHSSVDSCQSVRRGGHIARTIRGRRMVVGSRGTHRHVRGLGPGTRSVGGWS